MSVYLRATLVVAMFLPALTADAATLGLVQTGKAQPPTGGLNIPVHLDVDTGEAVAGIQFDVIFDPSALRFDRIDAGTSTASAEKSVHSNLLAPGKLRVVIAGLNRNVMAEGPVCHAWFNTIAGSGANTSATLENGVLSDPFGSPVRLVLSPQTLVLEQQAGEFMPVMATGTTIPQSGPGDPFGAYRAVIVALLCVLAAVIWTRHAPKKGRKR